MILIQPNFKIVMADPPWRFKNWSMDELTQRGEKWARKNGRSPYPVMTTDDICKMPVGDMVDKDALLYLWATGPKKTDALLSASAEANPTRPQ